MSTIHRVLLWCFCANVCFHYLHYLFPTFDVGNSTDLQLWIVHTIVTYWWSHQKWWASQWVGFSAHCLDLDLYAHGRSHLYSWWFLVELECDSWFCWIKSISSIAFSKNWFGNSGVNWKENGYFWWLMYDNIFLLKCQTSGSSVSWTVLESKKLWKLEVNKSCLRATRHLTTYKEEVINT